MRGKLVVFEGGEGAGKSTQLRRLAARLAAAGVAHRVLREPGGTPLGDRVRELVLHTELEIAPATEALLFAASRAQLVRHEITPTLERGEHVLLDRFLLSSYAYQAIGRGLPLEHVRDANALATGGLRPDLTVLLTLSSADGLARANARSGHDRIERADPAFHRRVAEAFATFATPAWQIAHPECGPIHALDGAGSEDAVEARVGELLATNLPALAVVRGVA